MRTLLLILVVILYSLAGAAEGTNRAFINPRISSRQVSLNQLVQIGFTTLKPQVDGIDTRQVILNALHQPDARKRWRLVGDVTAEVDKKIGTLEIKYRILPRKAGLLPLPEIPLKWLPDNTIATMGTVEVFDSIQMGSSQIPVPRENERMHDYVWGTGLEAVLEDLDTTATLDRATGAKVVRPTANLELLFHEGVFAAARIRAPGLSLEQARDSFMKRWGDPIGEVRTEDGKQVITWMFGWIRIEAHAVDDGALLYVIQEEIESRLASQAVQEKVFALIEGEADSDTAEGSEGEEDSEGEASPTRGDETEDGTEAHGSDETEIDQDDFDAAFERRRRELLEGE